MSNYRDRTVPPTSIAAIAQPLVNSIHLELKAVYEILMFVCRDTDFDLSHIESLIDGEINQAKEEA